MKCDEAKPECRRCFNTGRKCDGYEILKDPPKPTKHDTKPRPLLPASGPFRIPPYHPANKDGWHEFDFFRTQTAPNLAGRFGTGFWNRLLLQIGDSEPTVWHAIIAVSSIHRHSISNYFRNSNRDNTYRQVALDHYNKAITRLTRSQKQESIEVVLVTCVLFVCLELLLGNMDGAILHVRSGAKILRQSLNHETGKSTLIGPFQAPLITSSVQGHIRAILRRLGNQVEYFERSGLKGISAKLEISRQVS